LYYVRVLLRPYQSIYQQWEHFLGESF